VRHILEKWQQYVDTLSENTDAVLSEEEPYQKAVRLKHSKNRLTTKGEKIKEPPFVEEPPKERGKSAPPLEEEEEQPRYENYRKLSLEDVAGDEVV